MSESESPTAPVVVYICCFIPTIHVGLLAQRKRKAELAMRSPIPVLIFCGILSAQQPTAPAAEGMAGFVSGNIYSNQFFRVRLGLPSSWSVEGFPRQNAGTVHVLAAGLESASGSKVVISAIDFTGKPGFSKDSGDYLSSVISALQNDGWQSFWIGSYPRIGEKAFRRQNLKRDGPPPLYVAIMVSPSHGFEFRVQISAGSSDALERAVTTVTEGLKFSPDWSSGSDANDNGLSAPAPQSARGSAGDVLADGRSREATAPVPASVRLSQAATNANRTKAVQPAYPSEARSNGIQGAVVLDAVIGTDGAVQSLYLLEGNPALVPAVLEAVSKWRYVPYLLDGKPTVVDTQISVTFQL